MIIYAIAIKVLQIKKREWLNFKKVISKQKKVMKFKESIIYIIIYQNKKKVNINCICVNFRQARNINRCAEKAVS